MDKKKKTSIFRRAFIGPFILVALIIIGFNFFFLDIVLKNSIEFVAEEFHLAEVNVRGLRTNFLDLSVHIKKIEFTDKEDPNLNKVEVGNIKFAFLWDAILRAKIVIDLADLGDVQIGTKRSSRGRVFDIKDGESIADKTLENAKKEFDGNVFSDITSLLGGENLNDIGKSVGKELESDKKIQEIERSLKDKEAELSRNFKELPSRNDKKDFEKRLKKIKWKDLGNILKAPKVLSNIDRLKKDIDKARKSFDKIRKSTRSSISLVEKSYKAIDKAVESDIKKISARAKIPKLDAKSISRILFGHELVSEIYKYKHYFESVKSYVPKKKNEIKTPTRKKRKGGRNYSFGNQKSYPLFWLKHLRIESKNDQGLVEGSIYNILTDQNLINKPTSISIVADFPSENIFGLKFDGDIDLRDSAEMSSILTIDKYPVKNKKISKSKESEFTIKKAINKIKVTSTLKEERIDLVIKNILTEISYKASAESTQVKSILDEVSKRTPILKLDGKAQGKWDDIKFEMKSNLASSIQKAVGSLIQERIDKAKNDIRRKVNLQVADKKRTLKAQIDKFKHKFQFELDKGKNELNKIKNKIDTEKKAALKKTRKSGGNLLKGIKL